MSMVSSYRGEHGSRETIREVGFKGKRIQGVLYISVVETAKLDYLL